jgi:hypothetical protein
MNTFPSFIVRFIIQMHVERQLLKMLVASVKERNCNINIKFGVEMPCRFYIRNSFMLTAVPAKAQSYQIRFIHFHILKCVLY